MSGAEDWDGKLGFRNPPPWGRFQKGKSGNPKGRPRKKHPEATALTANASDEALRNQMEREFAIVENGKFKKVRGVEAVRKSQLKSAVGGNPLAQRLLLEDYRQWELRKAAEAERLAQEEDEHFERCKLWRDKQRRAWSTAEANGEEPEYPWPHPDDFIFNETKRTVRIRGPIDEDDVGRFEHHLLQRDIALAKSVEYRYFRRKSQRAFATMWDCIWMFWNAMLPKRWQITDPALEEAVIVIANTPAKLTKGIERDVQRAEFLRVLAKIPPPDKDAQRLADKILKPLLKRQGYHSLKPFGFNLRHTQQP